MVVKQFSIQIKQEVLDDLNYRIQKKAQEWIAQEGAYMSIQSTKSQTLAYSDFCIIIYNLKVDNYV